MRRTTSSDAGPAPADRRRERVDRDALDRILAGAVDVGQDDVIGASERRAERVHQRRGPRVPVRLKGDDDSPPQRPRRREHGGDFGRVMSVVVDDENAVRLAAHVEPPFDAAELRQPGRDAFERQSELQADRDRRQRVLQVVTARDVQRQRTERRAPRRTAAACASRRATTARTVKRVEGNCRSP